MRTRRREPIATVGLPPGPRGNVVLGSIGDLYRDRLRFVLDVARTYGDVAQYRVAHMRMYQVNHPAGVGRLLHDNHRNYSKDVATFGTLRLILGNGLLTSDGDFWRRQRRLAQPAFHRRRVAAFGHALGMRVLGLSFVTNAAGGAVSHEEVLLASKTAAEAIGLVVADLADAF